MNKKKLNYILSVPERIIKSIVTMGTGITSLLTKLLLPRFVKESVTYRVTFGMLQQFLIEKVAEVEGSDNEVVLKDHYMVRKTAGTILEGIGLIGIRFSPVWMLAILSDVSGGSKIYIQRLMDDLKKNRLIDPEVNYDNVSDLLEGINRSSAMGVSAFDTPPITVEELKEFKDTLFEQLKDNNEASKKMFQDLQNVYEKMRETGKKEKVTLRKLNGAMTLDLMKNTAKKGLDITKVTAGTSLELINEMIIQSYMDSLNQINTIGKRKYFSAHMTPFVRQFRKHFQREKGTITEKMLGKLSNEKEK